MAPMTKKQQLLRIKNDYRAAHGNTPAKPRAMIDWAIDTGAYKIDEKKARRRAAEELADAMRTEMTVDAHGNEIRVNLAFETPDEGWLWDQRDTIGRANMELNVSHGRRMVYGEIKAQVLSVNDYNERHLDEPPIQYSLNFLGDLADDGITPPASIGLEQLIGRPPADLADSAPSPEPSRSSSRPSSHASRLRGSSSHAPQEEPS